MLDLILLPWALPGKGKWGGEGRLHFFPATVTSAAGGRGEGPGHRLSVQLLLGMKIKTTHIFSPICQPLRMSRNKLPAIGQLDRLALEQTSAVTGTLQGEGKTPGPSRRLQDSSTVATKGTLLISLRELQGRLESSRWLSGVCL